LRAAPGRIEAGGGAPYFKQYLLGDLLGLGRIAQHLADEPVDRAGELVVHGLEGGVLAARHEGKQIRRILAAPLLAARTRLLRGRRRRVHDTYSWASPGWIGADTPQFGDEFNPAARPIWRRRPAECAL
jgi:hypothetical protein